MTRSRVWMALTFVVMLAPALVSAQGTTGSIAGFVTDDTGGALPGATVTVRHVETDQKRALVTDGAGRYREVLDDARNEPNYQQVLESVASL